jgi:RecB family exonuclease
MVFELNYSKINAYLFCHYLYKFVYIDKKYVKHNPKTSFGISIHRTLKEYVLKNADLKTMLNLYEENWVNCGYDNPRDMMEYYESGVDILKNFYEYDRKNATEVLFCEEYFDVDIGDGFALRGTVDRIEKNPDGSVNIIDYKMGFDEEKENPGNFRNYLQLEIYAYGISKKYDLKVSKIGYYFISIPKKVFIDYSYHPTLIDNIKRIGSMMRENIINQKGNCSICLIKDICYCSDFKKYE